MSKYRDSDAQRYADIFKALSNPYRIKIFMRLSSCCSDGTTWGEDGQICECVGILGKDLGIASSTISHHIKELHRAGLIIMTRQGQRTVCSVNPAVIDFVQSFFGAKSPV